MGAGIARSTPGSVDRGPAAAHDRVRYPVRVLGGGDEGAQRSCWWRRWCARLGRAGAMRLSVYG
ncbi:hypothetical protein [Nocardia sp. CNY236]|uniref:hypothetical protein n=1 Tax=Nocardia sp. CNY236 TaxID=1169152 RepID=UPI00040B4D75|nr:hypothetical protein [Nocardia sp. CNY236]